MRKSVEEILRFTAIEFAAYFNNRMAEALGRAGAAAGLTAAEEARIQESRRELYEKLKGAKDHRLSASIEAMYFELEEAYIKAAQAALQRGLDSAPAAGGAGAAGVTPASIVAARSSVVVKTSRNPLAADVLRSIASFLPPQGKGRLAAVSKAERTHLEGDLKRSKFLLHVARGQQDHAEAMLRADRSLLTQAGNFTDYSGRSFNCTAYEYAYWAKDTHMCRMLERYMNEKAKAFLRERIDKIEAIDPATAQARGLVYWQNGTQHRSAHFDFRPLISALQNYLDSFDTLYSAGRAALSIEWLKVGLAQRDVPIHVAQEYCRPARPFFPCPLFNETTRASGIPSNTSDLPSYSENWFPLSSTGSGLGYDFAVVRAGDRQSARFMSFKGGWPDPGTGSLQADVAALRRLDEVRTTDLRLSREHLSPSTPASLEETSGADTSASDGEASHFTPGRGTG